MSDEQEMGTEDRLRAEIAEMRAEMDSVAGAVVAPAGASPMGFAENVRGFRHLLEGIRAMVVQLDAEGRVLGASPTLHELIGLHPEEVVRRRALNWVHREDRAPLLELFRKLIETGDTFRRVVRTKHTNGNWFQLEVTATRGTLRNGAIGAVAFVRDMTELLDTLRALSDSEERFRALAENASDLITEFDEEGRILYVSAAARRVIGDDRGREGSDLVDLALSDAVHPDDRHLVLPKIRSNELADGDSPRPEVRIRDSAGRYRWIETRGNSYRASDGKMHTVTIGRDVTERIEAQAQLRESEERYRLLATTARDVVTETGPDRTFVYISDTIREVLAYEPTELVGSPALGLVHPDDAQRVKQDYWGGLQSGGVFTRPYRCRHKDGSYRWVEGTGVTYERADGLYVIGLMRDVSERLAAEAERRALEERMQHAQKLESLGVMAGGIAHDFNNLLTPILGQAALLQAEFAEGSGANARLDRILKAAQRAAGLTRQMLAYAGTRPLQSERIHLSALVREMADLLESAASGRSKLHFELAEKLSPIEADTSQVSQVVMNLLSNAIEAVDEGEGRIDVRTAMLDGEQISPRLIVVGDARAGQRYVSVEVEDTGCGIDDERRGRIFDPFFTTKFTGRGLGLAAVVGIVSGHGGCIELESVPGQGTRFRVSFPAASSGVAQPAASRARETSWQGSGLVLIADDDEGVREIAADTLRRCGLDVIEAADGHEAIETFRARADEICAVVLDRTMPLVSGEQALDAIRKIRSGVPILLFSGYSEEVATEGFSSSTPDAFLSKPFLPADLSAEMRRLLDGG